MLEHIDLYKKIKIKEEKKEILSVPEIAFIKTFQQISRVDTTMDNSLVLHKLCEQLAKNLN